MKWCDWQEALWTLFYPAYCLGCGKGVEKRGQWCVECREKIRNIRQLPLRQGSPLIQLWVLGDYQGILREKLLEYKFPPYRRTVRFALQNLVEECLEKLSDLQSVDIVTPIPLHPQRNKERGFNQSEEIFRAGFLKQGKAWCHTLTRVKETKMQFQLETMEERRRNMKNAFLFSSPIALKNKTILLVDDIVTSGATLEEAARVLKNAGAAKIVGLALASGAMIFE